MFHRRTARYGALLGLSGLALGAGPARRIVSPASPPGAPGCRVILAADGYYRLTIDTEGPIPVVTFQGARGPIFDRIHWSPSPSEAMRRCDKPMGELKIDPSPNTTPIIYQVTNEMWSQIRVDHPMPYGGKWSARTYPYRDFGNMAAAISRDQLWAAFRQVMTDIATKLIARYADPGGVFSDAGAKWVARQAVKLMMQSYVEGRDPGLIIDGMLTDMVGYLEGHAESAAEKLGGPRLKAAVRGRLKQLAAAVTAELVEAQPDGQTVQVSAYNADDDCTHFFTVWWNFKGGGYRGVLTISCGPAPQDAISNTQVTSTALSPGGNSFVTAQALSQLRVPFPLQAATVTGIAPVQGAGAGEPVAVLAGAQATFAIAAAKIRADSVYDFVARLTTNNSTGRLTGTARGTVTVLNVAPTFLGATPKQLSAPPGGVLDLGRASLFVNDRNADAGNPGEVPPTSIALVHPSGLHAMPPFGPVTGERLADSDPSSGMLRFDFDGGRSRVADPHLSGTFEIGITAADNQGAPVSGTIEAIVENVAPTVEHVTVTPEFVHQNGNARIQVRLRVRDANTFHDITGVSVDARQASTGGGIYGIGSGLKEVAHDSAWIEYELALPFDQQKRGGVYPIPIEVKDPSHLGIGKGVLHVGNEAPVIGGHGFILDADSVRAADDPTRILLAPPKGLCPNDHFRAGLITRDPEGDTLDVKGIIVETGAEVTFRNSSGAIWIGDMQAPPKPGHYTLRLLVQERPRDKHAQVEMPFEVLDCGGKRDDDKVALGDPATPEDIATAPRDPAGQAQFALLGGRTIAATSAAGPPNGPSAAALLDSLRLVLSEVAGPGRPPIETYILATGGSTGPVGQLFAINRSGQPLRLPTRAVVVEPVAITPAIQSRVTGLLQRYVAAGGSPLVLDMYCLEMVRLPPAAGTLLRIVGGNVAAPFERYTGILDAARRVRDAGGLHPDSDPEQYFHAIRQWALWSAEEDLDAERFTDAFVTISRRTIEGSGEVWTDQTEQALRRLAPNRWNDVQRVLHDAGFPEP